MKQEMPSQEEFDAVVWYVLKRPLSRPNTSFLKASLYIAAFLMVNVLVILLLHYAVEGLGIFAFLPRPLQELYSLHHNLFVVLLSLLQFAVGGVIVLKPAIIGAVHLYQRYAPEDVRRRCLFKPTCSEYTILVIQKYGVIRGLHKAYIRVFKKCKGRIYRIDEP